MPRRRIRNEEDAAELLADCALRAARGELAAHQLHAINSAMTTYGSLRREQRQEQLAQEVRDEIDRIFADSRGAALHFRRKLTPPIR
jgi:outer membrane protein TolC